VSGTTFGRRLAHAAQGELVHGVAAKWRRQVGVVEDRWNGRSVFLGHHPCPVSEFAATALTAVYRRRIARVRVTAALINCGEV
jgi:hypothetical protein